MKVITYNIWNTDTSFDERMNLLSDVLQAEKADVIALQEVRSERVVNELKKKLGMKFHYFKKYHDCQEGLAVLTKYPILEQWTNWDKNTDTHNSGIMYLKLSVGNKVIGITNIHLDYKSALSREIEIIKAIENNDLHETDYDLILGDFNTVENSSIYRYLMGYQSLGETSTQWIDIGKVHAHKAKNKLEPTLDFDTNFRWDSYETLEVPYRFDWILLKETYPSPNPKLLDYRVIGKDRVNYITASDHYGVVCELSIFE